MIKPNEGKLDRAIRISVGVLVLLWVNFPQLVPVGNLAVSGWLRWVIVGLGVVLIVTGITGFCGLYRVFGISTCPVKKSK